MSDYHSKLVSRLQDFDPNLKDYDLQQANSIGQRLLGSIQDQPSIDSSEIVRQYLCDMLEFIQERHTNADPAVKGIIVGKMNRIFAPVLKECLPDEYATKIDELLGV